MRHKHPMSCGQCPLLERQHNTADGRNDRASATAPADMQNLPNQVVRTVNDPPFSLPVSSSASRKRPICRTVAMLQTRYSAEQWRYALLAHIRPGELIGVCNRLNPGPAARNGPESAAVTSRDYQGHRTCFEGARQRSYGRWIEPHRSPISTVRINEPQHCRNSSMLRGAVFGSIKAFNARCHRQTITRVVQYKPLQTLPAMSERHLHQTTPHAESSCTIRENKWKGSQLGGQIDSANVPVVHALESIRALRFLTPR